MKGGSSQKPQKHAELPVAAEFRLKKEPKKDRVPENTKPLGIFAVSTDRKSTFIGLWT